MEFRILGPIEVENGSARLPLDAPKQRALLGVLLLHPNEVVSAERLIDELWGGRPPATATKVVRTYVSQLRRLLGADTIATHAPGYLLRVDDDALDSARFQRLIGESRRLAASGDHQRAADTYREALALWRGPPLADVVFESFARNEAERLDEERLSALMERIDCDLGLGRHEEVLAELETLVGQYPMRERLRAQLMLAMYRSGRQADALEVYRKTRRRLVEELGIEPGLKLQDLERSMLRQDPSLESTEATAPASLPIPPTRLVGRDRELADVGQLLTRDDVRLITITGPGGVGKTRLALEAARRATRRVVFVDLGPQSEPQQVLPAIAHAFGVREQAGPWLDHRSVARVHALGDCLLLLDSFERVIEAAPALGRLLAECPNLELLITSRERLHLNGELEYTLTPLSEPSAVELFHQRAEAARFEFDASEAEVIGICRRLDCLPLGVELAAAQVKVLSAQALLERLKQRFPLPGHGPSDAPERQRTLEETLAWSYDLLNNEEQLLLRRLSVFGGGCTLEAFEHVCEGTVDMLAALIDKSLVTERDDRFTMLDTIRDFAADRLSKSGEAHTLQRRHYDYYIGLGERARSDEGLPSLLSTSERENFKLAIAWGIHRDPTRFRPLWRGLPES